jgi:hypothetical protein
MPHVCAAQRAAPCPKQTHLAPLKGQPKGEGACVAETLLWCAPQPVRREHMEKTVEGNPRRHPVRPAVLCWRSMIACKRFQSSRVAHPQRDAHFVGVCWQPPKNQPHMRRCNWLKDHQVQTYCNKHHISACLMMEVWQIFRRGCVWDEITLPSICCRLDTVYLAQGSDSSPLAEGSHSSVGSVYARDGRLHAPVAAWAAWC